MDASKTDTRFNVDGAVNMMPGVISETTISTDFEAFKAEAEPVARESTTQWETQGTAVVFTVPEKTTVPSGMQNQRVTLAAHEWPVYFRHSVVPERRARAFLKAKVVNTSEVPLIAGPASIFLDNTYITASAIPQTQANAEFWIFLGVDDAVEVTYKDLGRVLDERGKKRLEYTVRHETTLKNNKNEAVEVIVFDRYPVVHNEEVEIKLLLPEPKTWGQNLKIMDNHTMQYLLQLKPGETVKLPLHFELKAPRERKLTGF